MINKRMNFKEQMTQQGSMLIELLMSVALAAIIMPFIFKYQQSVVQRAENIAITKQMESIQSALERYIVDNRESLLMTVGKNITRVNISDLEQYGLSPDISSSTSGQYQLRVLKSNDVEGRATLQGVIVFSSDEITPMCTREIVSMGGDSMGFIEGNRAYGTFGAWRADSIDLGLDTTGLLLALLLTQIVAFPAALIFGKLSNLIENTKLIKVCILAYFLIALYGITLQQQYQFWILAVGVGIFQGAIQSLSRSYYAKIIPANRSGEYFGLYDICGKGASFMGTTLVSLISQVTGMMNIGVGSLAIMFFIGFVFFKKTEKLHQ